MGFAEQYGPWALIAGASEGVGAEFAAALADRGLNIVLLARRREVLEEIARGLRSRHSVEVRVLAHDLAEPDAASLIQQAVSDLEVGFLVYCAGADPLYQPFLQNSLANAESIVHRNCTVPMQLTHHLAAPMAERGRGGIIWLGSGAGLAGAPNMAAYAATKAFDMVFIESLWGELRPAGVDVLGLVLGETDTPALRRLKAERGMASGPEVPVKGAQSPRSVVREALNLLTKGPTQMANRQMRWGLRLVAPVSRNSLVRLMTAASKRTIGEATRQ